MGDNIWSEKAGHFDGFYSQLRVYPFGRSIEDEHANAYIYVFCGSGVTEWTCDQVDFDIICWDAPRLQVRLMFPRVASVEVSEGAFLDLAPQPQDHPTLQTCPSTAFP